MRLTLELSNTGKLSALELVEVEQHLLALKKRLDQGVAGSETTKHLHLVICAVQDQAKERALEFVRSMPRQAVD